MDKCAGIKPILAIIFAYIFCLPVASWAKTPAEVLANMHWYGQSAIRIDTGGKRIYIDPFRVSTTEPADAVFITHCHADHLSPADIKKIAGPATIFVAPASCVPQIKAVVNTRVQTLLPGTSASIDGIKVQAVPAYNVVKTNFHPRSNNWVGYILDIDGVRVYHAGDTERIPEMQNIDADIAMLPLGQTYTMNLLSEAVAAALDIKVVITVPIHYGIYEGRVDDARTFADKLADSLEVVIMEKEAVFSSICSDEA